MRVAILTDEESIARNIVAALPTGAAAVVVRPGEEPPLDVDAAIFFSEALSRSWCDGYRQRGVLVIDHSTAARMDPSIPTVVPHVNPGALVGHPGIVASPNCATALLVTALGPLHAAFGIRRVVVTTLQAISGAGDEAAARFAEELMGGDRAFPKPMEGNFHARIPQASVPREDGMTAEEFETAEEVRRILGGDPPVRVSATCVRVPVRNAHGIAVHLELASLATREAAEAVLAAAPLVRLSERDDFPTPVDVSGQDDVHVGRIRVDMQGENGLALFLVGDNLRRGTSLNAVESSARLLVLDEVVGPDDFGIGRIRRAGAALDAGGERRGCTTARARVDPVIAQWVVRNTTHRAVMPALRLPSVTRSMRENASLGTGEGPVEFTRN